MSGQQAGQRVEGNGRVTAWQTYFAGSTHTGGDQPDPDVSRARSLVTLRYIEGRLYLDPIRECYEAFVIYNFYMFLIAYLEVGAAGYSVSLKGFPAAEKQKHYSEDESVTTMP